jgi:hypothetical protein
MQYLSTAYLVNQPLHVSGIFVARHQGVYCIYTSIGKCCGFQLTVCWPGWFNRQSTENHNTYQLLYIYSIPPDDGPQICPKHEEVDWRNKLRINSPSSWFSVHGYIKMHGQQNINCPETSFWWPTKNRHWVTSRKWRGQNQMARSNSLEMCYICRRNIGVIFLLLHRALRIIWQYTNWCTYIKLFHIGTLKLLRHVSIQGSSSGSYTFLAKVTFKK